MIKFEDVKSQTTEDYFNNNRFSIDAFNKKYKMFDEETYVIALKRVCDFVASVEKTKELKKYWSERWFDEIYNDWWHPAGSIMQGAGSNKNISLSNCTTNSLGSLRDDEEWDNLESIYRNLSYTVAKCSAFRQGLGVDFSRLRPRNTAVMNSSNESLGSVHWMETIDSIAYRVGQKGRIPAMLFSLNIKHPDIEEFIKVKSDYSRIQNANISVQITNDFYKACEKDKDWILSFEIPEVKKGEIIYIDVHSIDMDSKQDNKGRWYKIANRDRKQEVIEKKVKANDLLKLLVKNMKSNAEPGIQNIDIAKKYSNSDYLYDEQSEYDSRIISSNACSEQYLSRDSLCVLASINGYKFSEYEEKYKKELEVISPSINRFLDNVNECELVYKTYATPHQRLAIESLRRTGAGLTDLSGWFLKNNIEYGSEESIQKAETFVKWYSYYLYRSSISLGEEKGSFDMFNREKILNSPFIKRMKKTFSDLKFDTLRNVTTISFAPTGTLSLMFRNMVFGYSIEPSFGIYFWKRTRMSGKYVYYFCVPKIVRDVFEQNGLNINMVNDTIEDTWDGKYGKPIQKFIDDNISKIGIKFIDSMKVDSMSKMNLLSAMMKWVDSSISTTFMLSDKVTDDEIINLILEGWRKEVKSISMFTDKKMYGIVSFISFKDLAFKLKDENVTIHSQNFSEEELKELNFTDDNISYTSSPKRPKELDGDVYVISVKEEKFVVAIGLLNGTPYEIFGGHINGFTFKFKHKKGKIIKIKSGTYKLEIGEDFEIKDFSEVFKAVEKSFFRSLSLMLRHGIPIKFVVEQLQKAEDDMFSIASATARVLKKYIKDGEMVTGVKCPQCKEVGTLIYKDGCNECLKCGYSKC